MKLKQHLKRVSNAYSPTAVLPLATATKTFKDFIGINGETFKVNMSSQRYSTFARDNCKCQACGLTGTVMFLEQQHSAFIVNNAHFNLYGIEHGQEILFTKDHIVPRSKKGQNHIDNFQTHCIICNLLKDATDATNQQIAERRKEMGSNFQEMKNYRFS